MAANPARDPEISTETLCALLLGRLQVGLTRGDPGTLRMFAFRVLRESMVAALREEGHQFTDERFGLWFAGLQTLTDFSEPNLRSPKAIGQAILTELRHSSWEDLASAAQQLENAFLAPSDFGSGDDHAEANALIAEARDLLDGLRSSTDALPFAPLRLAFAAAAQSVRFARAERAFALVGARAIEQARPGGCTWAIDLVAGHLLSPRHGLPLPTPLPGLLSLPETAFDRGDGAPDGRIADAAALTAAHGAFGRLDRWLDDADRNRCIIQDRLAGRRSSGRARRLAECLAGFGAMSGKQIGLLLGATRVGVDLIASTLNASGLLIRDSRPNAHRTFRYEVSDLAPDANPHAPSADVSTRAVIAEYEDSMREIDELLSRSSRREDL